MRLAIATLLLCACGPHGKIVSPPTTHGVAAPSGLRLPPGVAPLGESLELAVDPADAHFSGRATIDLAIARPTNVIWLHALGLELRSAKLGALTATVRDPGQGMIGLIFPEELPAGAATLRLEYAGTLESELVRGAYRATESDGATYVYTFFEPTDARRVFPCFDEPGYKIPWRLTLVVPAGLQALSNAPISGRDRNREGKSVVTFAETRPLPSYLVAFVVGPFDVVPAGSVGLGHVPFRFVVPRGRGGAVKYALHAVPRVVDLLEELLGVPYPFEKLDIVAIPRATGTMEHPGLVAIGQPLLFLAGEGETESRRRGLVDVTAHELAHIWFGDLVTNAWWDDIWLNEALATWADVEVTTAFDVTWRYELEAVGRRDEAMASDALPSARKVKNPVTTADELAGSFDPAISYEKGAAVLAMFGRWLGPKRFRQVLGGYLAAHAGKSVTTDDLVAAFDPSSDHALGDALRGFVDQAGVPLVSARPSCTGKPAIVLSQRRFVPAGVSAPDQRWAIPVCVAYGDEGHGRQRKCRLLRAESEEMPVDRCPTWILPNEAAFGYYRSEVTAKDAAALLATGELTAAERVGLVGDVAAQIGTTVPLPQALGLVPTLAADPDTAVVAKSVSLAQRVRRGDLVPELSSRYARFLRKAYGPLARALGWARRPGEPDAQARLRLVLLPLVAREADDAPLAEEARQRAALWLDRRGDVDPELLGALLDTAGANRSLPLWHRLRDAARGERDAQVRALLLDALGGFDDVAFANDTLALIDKDQLGLDDAFALVARQLEGRQTREVAYGFIKSHWEALVGRIRDEDALGLLASVTAFCDPGHRDDAATFFAPRAAKIPGGLQTLAVALEAVDVCIARTRTDAAGLEAFLLRQ